MLRRVAGIFSALILLLLAVMLVKTCSNSPELINQKSSAVIVSDTSAFSRLATAIRFRTINGGIESTSALYTETDRFFRWIRQSYPWIDSVCRTEKIGNSLLIHWKGSDNQKPVLFLAHTDVVPAEGRWKHPPYQAVRVKDTLFGRGTLDDKNTAIALLEALTRQIKRGFIPKRSVYIALGHDEETGGYWGARQIAEHFRAINTTFEFIADEGFGVMEGIVPGLQKPCAIVGLAEKGELTLRLQVDFDGGHSAWPSPQNASSTLTAALHKVEQFQFDARIDGPVKMLFEEAGKHMDFGYKFLFSNLWITSPLVKSQLLKSEKTAASIRTTHVTTKIQAGVKDNVVPSSAFALINFRIIPGTSIASIKKQIEEIVGDKRVKITIEGTPIEASPVSPAKGFGYSLIKSGIRQVFPESVIAPGIVITGTDCKNYVGLSDCIYRFVPFRFNNHNLKGIHGENEYITLSQFSEGIAYYSFIFGNL